MSEFNVPGFIYISEMEDLTPEQRQEIIGIAGFDFRSTSRDYDSLLEQARECAEFAATGPTDHDSATQLLFKHYGPVFPTPTDD